MGSARPEVRQDVQAGRDAHVAGHDIISIEIHQALPALPPIRAWGGVPARNPAFTGREDQLTAIREALLSGNRAAVQALHGMGGVGKTQVAIEYAHRFSDDYDVVWWLDAENTVLFGQQYADLAVMLGCAEPGSPPDVMRRALLSDLHHRPRWLLIFDNAESPDTVRDWLPGGRGHAIITSRSAAWAEMAVPVPVDVLTRVESVELWATTTPTPCAPRPTSPRTCAHWASIPRRGRWTKIPWHDAGESWATTTQTRCAQPRTWPPT